MHTRISRRLLAAALAAALAMPAVPATLAAPSDAAATALLQAIDTSYASPVLQTQSSLSLQTDVGVISFDSISGIKQNERVFVRGDLGFETDSNNTPATQAMLGDDTLRLKGKVTLEAELTNEQGGLLRMRADNLQLDATGSTGKAASNAEAAQEWIKLIMGKTFAMSADELRAHMGAYTSDTLATMNVADSVAGDVALARALVLGKVLLVETTGTGFAISINKDVASLDIPAAARELRKAKSTAGLADMLEGMADMSDEERTAMIDTYRELAETAEVTMSVGIQYGRISSASINITADMAEWDEEATGQLRISGSSAITYPSALPVSTLASSGDHYIDVAKLSSWTTNMMQEDESGDDTGSDSEEAEYTALGTQELSKEELREIMNDVVPTDAWYRQTMLELVDQGVIDEYVEPTSKVTYGYWRDVALADSDHPLPVGSIDGMSQTDTLSKLQVLELTTKQTAGSQDYVEWALQHRVVDAGFNKDLAANTPATMAEAYVILARAWRAYRGEDGMTRPNETPTAWYQEAFASLEARGLLTTPSYVDPSAPVRHRLLVEMLNTHHSCDEYGQDECPYSNPLPEVQELSGVAPYAALTKQQALELIAGSAAQAAGADSTVTWAKERGVVGSGFAATASEPATLAEAYTMLARTLPEYERLLRANGDL